MALNAICILIYQMYSSSPEFSRELWPLICTTYIASVGYIIVISNITCPKLNSSVYSYQRFPISSDATWIPPVAQLKDLGVIIDSFLSFMPHTRFISKSGAFIFKTHSESDHFSWIPLLSLWLSLLPSLTWVVVISSHTASLFTYFIQFAWEQSILYTWARVSLLKLYQVMSLLCLKHPIGSHLTVKRLKALHDLLSPFSHVISLLCLENFKYLPASGPLYLCCLSMKNSFLSSFRPVLRCLLLSETLSDHTI